MVMCSLRGCAAGASFAANRVDELLTMSLAAASKHVSCHDLGGEVVCTIGQGYVGREFAGQWRRVARQLIEQPPISDT